MGRRSQKQQYNTFGAVQLETLKKIAQDLYYDYYFRYFDKLQFGLHQESGLLCNCIISIVLQLPLNLCCIKSEHLFRPCRRKLTMSTLCVKLGPNPFRPTPKPKDEYKSFVYTCLKKKFLLCCFFLV